MCIFKSKHGHLPEILICGLGGGSVMGAGGVRSGRAAFTCLLRSRTTGKAILVIKLLGIFPESFGQHSLQQIQY